MSGSSLVVEESGPIWDGYSGWYPDHRPTDYSWVSLRWFYSESKTSGFSLSKLVCFNEMLWVWLGILTWGGFTCLIYVWCQFGWHNVSLPLQNDKDLLHPMLCLLTPCAWLILNVSDAARCLFLSTWIDVFVSEIFLMNSVSV